LNNWSILEQAAKSAIAPGNLPPSPAQVVEALLEAEKVSKQNKTNYAFEQLIGNWRLCFITGTKKTRQKAGKVLGAGRYIPQLIKIQLSYSPNPIIALELPTVAGQVVNSITLGKLKLELTGPAKFLGRQNLLAFDFTQITLQLFGTTLYQGGIWGGNARETEFYTAKIGKQAFFGYFLVGDRIIAARGRGGGLALWSKNN